MLSGKAGMAGEGGKLTGREILTARGSGGVQGKNALLYSALVQRFAAEVHVIGEGTAGGQTAVSL
jgi:hypothetical protein